MAFQFRYWTQLFLGTLVADLVFNEIIGAACTDDRALDSADLRFRRSQVIQPEVSKKVVVVVTSKVTSVELIRSPSVQNGGAEQLKLHSVHFSGLEIAESPEKVFRPTFSAKIRDKN